MGQLPDNHRSNILRWYFVLGAVEGALAIIALLSLPGSAMSRGLLSLSPGRLALAAPALLLVSAFAWAAVKTWWRPAWAERQSQRLAEFSRRDGVYWMALTLFGLAFILCINLLLLNWKNTDQYVQAYLMRLATYAWWGVLLSIQSALALRELRNDVGLKALSFKWRALIPFTLLLLLAGFIAVTKLGLAPDLVAWGDPGVPILSWQVVLALAITAVCLLGGRLLLSLLTRWSPLLSRRLLISLSACSCGERP